MLLSVVDLVTFGITTWIYNLDLYVYTGTEDSESEFQLVAGSSSRSRKVPLPLLIIDAHTRPHFCPGLYVHIRLEFKPMPKRIY